MYCLSLYKKLKISILLKPHFLIPHFPKFNNVQVRNFLNNSVFVS